MRRALLAVAAGLAFSGIARAEILTLPAAIQPTGGAVSSTPSDLAARNFYATDVQALCNDAADDTAYLNSITANASPVAVIHFPPGRKCLVSGSPAITAAKSGQTFAFEPGAWLKCRALADVNCTIIRLAATNIRLIGDRSGGLDGNRAAVEAVGGTSSGVEGLEGTAVADNPAIEGITLKDFAIDPVSVSGFQKAGGVATLTTAPNNYTVGQSVVVSNLLIGTYLNGTQTITARTSTSVSFATDAATVSFTADTGAGSASVSVAGAGRAISLRGVQNVTIRRTYQSGCGGECTFYDNQNQTGLTTGLRFQDNEGHRELETQRAASVFQFKFKTPQNGQPQTQTYLQNPVITGNYAYNSTVVVPTTDPVWPIVGAYSPIISNNHVRGGWYGFSIGSVIGGEGVGNTAAAVAKAGAELGNALGFKLEIGCENENATPSNTQYCAQADGQNDKLNIAAHSTSMMGAVVNVTSNQGSVSSFSIDGASVVTVENSKNNDIGPGNKVRLTGLSTGTYLNNIDFTVLTVTYTGTQVTSFTASSPAFTHATTGGTVTDSGQYTPLNTDIDVTVDCKLITTNRQCVALQFVRGANITGGIGDGGGLSATRWVQAVDSWPVNIQGGQIHDMTTALDINTAQAETLTGLTVGGLYTYNMLSTTPVTGYDSLGGGSTLGVGNTYCGLAFSAAAMNSCANPSPFTNFVLLTASSANWTVPDGVTQVEACLQAGGGGGGGVNTASAAASGGSQGEYQCVLYGVTPGASIAYTNPSGGAGGAAGSNGVNGGAPTFGTLTARPGPGGIGSVSGAAAAPNAPQATLVPFTSGVHIISDYLGAGGAKGSGTTGGVGERSLTEFGGAGGATTNGSAASSGGGRCGAGGGGAGGATAFTGGAGGPPCIILRY